MKKTFLVIGLIIFVVINTTHIFAYWQDTNNHHYVTNEKPVEIITQSMNSHEGYLVPKGVILSENEIENVIFTYKIFVQDGKELEVEIQNITINGNQLSDEIRELFMFKIEKKVIAKDTLTIQLFEGSEEGNCMEVTLDLSMNMPTSEQYKILSGGLMNFEVVFKAN